jgi:hypothetical protein
MEERLQTILHDLRRVTALPLADRNRCARRAGWLAEAAADGQRQFLRALGEIPLPLETEQEILLKTALLSLVQKRREAAASRSWRHETDTAADLLDEIVALYRQLGPPSAARGPLLTWLSLGGSRRELEQLADLLVDDPPSDEGDVVQALAPLFQQQKLPVEALFPRLLEALAHAPLAAAVLDLANYVRRRQIVSAHPAAERSDELQSMLGNLVGLLGRLEEAPDAIGDSPRELSRRVQQGVALAVSLCDALALIGDRQAIPKLFQALALAHRRIKTEAAAALARLGEERGREELIKLAAEPVARLRVLAYADELGLADRIDPNYRSPQARAEAELTVWLAEPTQYGLPPQSCELIDHRRQFWPGFSEPVECFLFRFTYAVTVDETERTYTGIGIAGPLAHAFTADLADLPPADIYAAYAGWQAEHAEIKEYEVEKLNRSGQTEVARLARRLHDAGYEQIEPRLMGDFFGDKVIVAQARQGKLSGVAVVDMQDILFFPARHPRRPLGVREAYCIYKGRKLLKTFNG